MTSEKSPGGIISYTGYEYQILGTIWVALNIIIKKQQCEQIIIEPVSQEDIELNLDVPEDQAQAKVGCLTSGKKVWIQIKKKTGSNWTPSQLVKIIANQPIAAVGKDGNKRVRAAEVMDNDPNLFFVLLTSSQANSSLRSFVVNDIGQETVHKNIHSALTESLTPEKASRIGILEQFAPQRLTLEIKEILQEILHVPSNFHDDCIGRITDAVRSRLLGQKPNELHMDEVLAICRRFGGCPVPPIDPFVEPTNAEDIRQYLKENGGIILIGPPGIGKTLFARHLSYEHQIEDNPYEIVRVEDPVEIEDRIADTGNILFLVEDPFGLYKLSEKVDRWTTELPRILPKARSDKRIVCTSRTSMMYLADSEEPPKSIQSAIFHIEEENYTYGMRSKIFSLALKDVDPSVRDFAIRHEPRILKHLRVPYSVVEFVRSLVSQNKLLDNDLEKLISEASTRRDQ